MDLLFVSLSICRFNRLNSNREDGIIQMKIGASDSWDSKWCVFEEGVLKHAPYNEPKAISESSFDHIPMDKVIKLRTDVSTKNKHLQISCISI